MKITISKAKCNQAKIANLFLTKLIRDEKKYDKNINEHCEVLCCYENLIQNDQNCILFALIDEKIVGYLYGYVMDIGDAYLDKVSQLEAMYVEEEYCGQRVGQRLINEFKRWSKTKGVKYIELKVCKENGSAISLYQKNGFSNIKCVMRFEFDDERL